VVIVDFYTSGVWKPKQGEEDAFVKAWTAFATWASEMPGAGTARLLHDLREPGRFVSILPWESMEAIRGWKDSPEFSERMGPVQRFVEEFDPTELEVSVAVGREVATAGD
jgi:heme-degrading monooxygenase HmoA